MKILTALILNIIPCLAFAQEGGTAKDSAKLSKILDGEIPIQVSDAFKKELEQSFTSSPRRNSEYKFNDFILDIDCRGSLIRHPQLDTHSLHIRYPLLSDKAYLKKSEYMAIKKLKISSTIYIDNPTINLERNTNLSMPVGKKLYFNIYGNYTIDKKRSVILPVSSIPLKVGTGVSYNIGKHTAIKTQTNYQYNTIQKKWEWFFGVGIAFTF